MTANAAQRRVPPWVAPAVPALLLLGALAAVLVLARRAAAPDVPPEPPAFQTPAPARPVVALDVLQVAAGRLALSDGSRDVALSPNARIEVLRPESAAGVRPGEWLTVIGVANEVRNFAIRSLVLSEGGGAADAEGVLRSAAGFAGHEAARDQTERPLLGGVVERVEGQRLVLRGPTGPVTVDLSPNAPLWRLAAAQPADIREGDRIAFPAGTAISDAAGVLVLPGGAR
jgi:hypothetical protein